MTTIQHFITDTQIKTYRFQNQSITLEINSKIFPPSKFGQLYGHYVKVFPNEKVIDIGTGSGILAILASKLGGNVYATDTSQEAIETTTRNAHRNNVELKLTVGEYFATFDEKFDVIIVNLPTEVVPNTYLNILGSGLAGTIDGGNRGNELVLKFLEIAPKYMKADTRIYIQIHTLSNFHQSIDCIVKAYNAKLIGFNPLPNKEFVADNISFYQKLNENGLVDIYYQNGVWMSNAFLFELTLQK